MLMLSAEAAVEDVQQYSFLGTKIERRLRTEYLSLGSEHVSERQKVLFRVDLSHRCGGNAPMQGFFSP